MNLSEEVIDATLEADGSLTLSHPPQLPPGPVRVTIQTVVAAPPSADWWAALQDTRRKLEALNYPTMTAAEVDRHVEWLRGDDDRIENVYREMEDHDRRQRLSG